MVRKFLHNSSSEKLGSCITGHRIKHVLHWRFPPNWRSCMGLGVDSHDLLGYYTASSGNSLPIFWETCQSHLQGWRILDPWRGKDWPLKRGLTSCPKTLVRNYHCLLRNNPEEGSFHLGRSLKSQDWKLSHVQINMVLEISGTLWKDSIHTSKRKKFALTRQNNLWKCTQRVAAHYKNYMVHINTQHGKNAELLNAKPGGTLGFRYL